MLSPVLVMLFLIAAGCQSTTGRSTGQWWDDKAITAKVKTGLAATKVATLTRIDVDTVDGVVYLTGVVENEATKAQAGEVARTVAEVRGVVNNLRIEAAARPEAPPPAASSTTAGSAATVGSSTQPVVQPGAPAATRFDTHPLTARFPKLARVDAEPGAGPAGPWAAYDASGRRVATVFSVPTSQLQQDGITVANVGRSQERVEDVSIYPHPGQQTLIVLWHVSQAESARLR
jgi:hypothetical protein